MKTDSKFSLLLITGAMSAIMVSCKHKTDSSVPDANSTEAVSAKGNSVMDSLKITDADEKKVCALYDDAITDYLTNVKTLIADTSKDAQDKRKALDDKWKLKEAEINPQLDAVRDKMRANPTEAFKFVQFSAYEAKRMMAVILPATENALKNLPVTTPSK